MVTELYKRFRPKSLDRMVGNKETVESLRQMIARKTVPHAVLFHGPSGTGKTTLARILARELQCSQMDMREMNCSSFRGIDTIREIMSTMMLSPTGGKCRVWILDECHKMTGDAQNASLKMLEDTPSHVYFFLCTTDPQKLIPTIRTRCTTMSLQHLKEEDLVGLIKRVAKKEEITVPEEVVEELIATAGGSPRTALVLLDKVRNLSPESMIEALKTRADEEREAIDLCRALIKKEKWPKVAGILKDLKGEPESIRRAVLGYARAVLLGGNNSQAYTIICAFTDPLYDSGEAGLARAAYEAIHG